MDLSLTPDPNQVGSWPEGMLALIPVYNHERTVQTVAADLLAIGAPVLVVDDGSTDGSGTAAAASGAELLTLSENCGKAAALVAGMKWAVEHGYRQVLTCDADGQHPLSEARKVAASGVSNLTAVHIGVRNMSVAPTLNRFGRWCSNASCWLCCGQNPGDSQTGLRVYPLPATTLLPIKAKRYAWEVEVLIRASWARIKLIQVPVEVLYPNDRVSHFNKLRDNIITALVLARLLARRFIPLGKRLPPTPENSLSG